MYARDIAALLDGKTKIKGNAIVGFCPVCQPAGKGKHGGPGHLHIEDKNDGWAHVSCLMSCPEDAIMAALGCENNDRCHTSKVPTAALAKVESVRAHTTIVDTSNLEWKPLKDVEWKIVTKYPYRDLDLETYFYKFRFKPTITKLEDGTEKIKKNLLCGVIEGDRICFSIKHLNGKGDLLYRWPEVSAALAAGATIYINEGEKACDRLAAAGLCGTCQPSGADEQGRNWGDVHTAMLKGAKDVVIIADRDAKGESYARAVCKKLKAARIPTRVVQSATTGEKDDAYDHLEAGSDVSAFIPRPDLEPAQDFQWANTIKEKEVDWLVYPTIPLGMLTGIEGQPGIGKGLLTCAMACAVSNGLTIGGFEDRFPKGKVLMLAFEDSAEYTIMKRLRKFGGDTTQIALNDKPFPFDHAGLERLDRMVESTGALLVTIDPVTSYLDPAVATKKITLREILATMKEISERHHCAIVCSRHLRKSSEDSDPINPGYGGIEIVGAYRSALAARKDPDKIGHVVVSHFKSNVGPIGKSFGYQILPTAVRGDFDFIWTGARKESAEEMMAKGKPRQRGGEDAPIERAREFLREILTAGYVESTEIFQEAKQNGISQKTLYRAKDEIGAKATKAGFSDGKWRWHLPTQETPAYNPFDDE